MRIDLACAAASTDYPNEDFLAAALPANGVGGIAVVLDGVTPPKDGRSGCRHTVSWFTTHLGGCLLQLVGTQRESTLMDCLAEALLRTAAAHGSECDLSHVRTPQATAAVLRWDDQQIEYLVLSDAVALLKTTAGTIDPVTDDRLQELIRRPDIRALLDEQRALPPGSAAREQIAMRVTQRFDALRNVEGGFFTAAADPDVARRARTGTRSRSDVRAAAIASDGVTRWNETFGLGDWAAMLEVLRNQGAQTLIDQVRTAEAADPTRTLFPRGKQYDDASVVYVEL